MARHWLRTPLILVILLSGCATPYVPPEGQATAKVNLLAVGSLKFCVGDKRFSVGSDNLVPAGKQLTLIANKSWAGYNVTYFCNPRVGFLPTANQSYFINFEVRDEKCFVEIYAEDAKERTGLIPQIPRKPLDAC